MSNSNFSSNIENTELTLVWRNPRKLRNHLEFGLAVANRDSGHYVCYLRNSTTHWFIFRRFDALHNSLAIKELESYCTSQSA